MQDLRRPLFLIALVLIVLTVLVEVGARVLLRGGDFADATVLDSIQEAAPAAVDVGSLDAQQRAELEQLTSQNRPPGLALPYLALLDGIVLFTVALMGAGLVVPERVQGRVQGGATLIFAVVLILLAIVLIIAAIAVLVLMVSLLVAAPFGTLTYLAIFGFFDRAGAGIALSVLMLLKLGFVVVLVLAQPRFLQNLGLVLLVLTSLLATVIVGFLHGIVPRFLVSITDAIAAIAVAVLAVIWAVVLLTGALPAIVRALRVERGVA